MNRIKRFNEISITESVRVLSPEEIEDCILDYTDTGQVNVKSLDQYVIRDIRKNYPYSNKKLVYKNSESSDKYLREPVSYKDFDSSRTVSLLIEIPHTRGIKGNLYLEGYTFDTIKYVFRRFIELTKRDYLVDIWIEILKTNAYDEPLAEVIVNVTFPMKKLNESAQEKEGDVLLIVDVQKSFKTFFTPNYLHQLKEYAKNFSEVYQIFDNHVDGKNVDKDYLYDDDHDVSVHDDLYWFPNQVDIIEKRYNYDVNVDFYKKILDKETYKRAKQLEDSNKLKPGDMFPTKGGTVITYIGNNHKWFHLPKKLYDLFMGLKGRKVIIVGGASSECLQDVFITATSLGIDIIQRHKYIYSASHCPL